MTQKPDHPMTLDPPRPPARPARSRGINRRSMLKGVGGAAALAVVGAGVSVAGAAPAQAAGLSVVEHQDGGRMQYYRFSTPSIAWNPAVNVLLPDGYTPARRYPVLYLLHGGGGDNDFRIFDKLGIRDYTVGRELIVVMPDGGTAGWYSNPVSSHVGPATGRPSTWASSSRGWTPPSAPSRSSPGVPSPGSPWEASGP